MRDFIKIPVELFLCDRLGIDFAYLNLVFVHLIFYFAQRGSKNFQISRLSRKGVADYHQSVPNQNHIIDLNDLVHDILVQTQFF